MLKHCRARLAACVAAPVWGADAYSPSRRLVIVEPSRPELTPTPAQVLDLRTGRVLAVGPAAVRRGF